MTIQFGRPVIKYESTTPYQEEEDGEYEQQFNAVVNTRWHDSSEIFDLRMIKVASVKVRA